MDKEALPSESALAPTTRRRRYSAAFKAQIIAECNRAEASVAGVAIRHGLNPNMVQKWRRGQQRAAQHDFVRLPAPVCPSPDVAAPAMAHGVASNGVHGSSDASGQRDRTLADRYPRAVGRLAASGDAMTLPASAGQIFRIDEIWLAREPLDMRCGPETTLARVIAAFGAAKPHCAYVFANKRANRMKVLLCDGFGIWLLARRLHQGGFVWSALREGGPVALDNLQLQALATGLPWQYASADLVIDRQ